MELRTIMAAVLVVIIILVIIWFTLTKSQMIQQAFWAWIEEIKALIGISG